MFASKEKKVIGVDVNQHAVDTINAGKIHIVEPELDVMVRKQSKGFLKSYVLSRASRRFSHCGANSVFTVRLEGSIPQPDLTYIQSAANQSLRY